MSHGGRGAVWNLQVEGAHAYYVSGVLCHNSDSCLYAFERHKHHYVSLLEEDKVGSVAWHLKLEAQDQREAETEQAKERAEQFVR